MEVQKIIENWIKHKYRTKFIWYWRISFRMKTRNRCNDKSQWKYLGRIQLEKASSAEGLWENEKVRELLLLMQQKYVLFI